MSRSFLRVAAATGTVLACLLASPGSAGAAWPATGTGAAKAVAMTVPASSRVTATRSTLLSLVAPTFTVVWTPVTVPFAGSSGTPANLPVTGYRIQRYRNGIFDANACTDAATSATTTTCSETVQLVNNTSTYTYRVSALFATWTGPAAISGPA